MSLAERTDGNRLKSGVAQTTHPARPPQLRNEIPAPAFKMDIGGSSTVSDCAVMNTELPRDQRGPTWQARSIGDVAMLEPYASRRQRIQIRTGVPVVTVATQVVRT